jgi:hypothetical protein
LAEERPWHARSAAAISAEERPWQYGMRGRMQPSRWRRGKRREKGWVEAREGKELCLAIPPLDLHGARSNGKVLEPAAGDVLGADKQERAWASEVLGAAGGRRPRRRRRGGLARFWAPLDGEGLIGAGE